MYGDATRKPPVPPGPPPTGTYLDRLRWLAVRNDDAADCPPGGLLRVTGSDVDGALLAEKPDANDQAGLLAAHPLAIIPSGEYGWATYDEPAPVAYNAGTPAVAETTWGAASGSWYLTSGRSGYRVVADPEATQKLVEVVRTFAAAGATVKGKLDGALAFDGSATMSVWAYNGAAEADTGDNLTVYDWLLSSGQTVASGARVTAAYDARSGRYYLTGAQC